MKQEILISLVVETLKKFGASYTTRLLRSNMGIIT